MKGKCEYTKAKKKKRMKHGKKQMNEKKERKLPIDFGKKQAIYMEQQKETNLKKEKNKRKKERKKKTIILKNERKKE